MFTAIRSGASRAASGVASKIWHMPKIGWVILIAILAVAAYFIYRKLNGSSSDDPYAQTETEQMDAARARIRDKEQLRSEAANLAAQALQIKQLMATNQAEAVENHRRFESLFAASSQDSIFQDDDDFFGNAGTGMLDTSFMRNGEIDERKEGMMELAQELGHQQSILASDLEALKREYNEVEKTWQMAYPDEPLDP